MVTGDFRILLSASQVPDRLHPPRRTPTLCLRSPGQTTSSLRQRGQLRRKCDFYSKKAALGNLLVDNIWCRHTSREKFGSGGVIPFQTIHLMCR
jgi:hypothetical protein